MDEVAGISLKKEAFIGYSDKESFFYPLENLKKHVIALGSSGSGKTVLAKVLIEECARNNVPAIVVDPQGDLASLALMGNIDQVKEKTGSDEGFLQFKDDVRVTVFTPVSSKGIPLCINPLRLSKVDIDEEEVIPVINSVANSLAKLLGFDPGKDSGKSAEAILYTVLKYHYHKNKTIGTFEELASILMNLDSSLQSDISVFLKNDDDLKLLIRKIKFLSFGEKELLFQFGVPVDIDLLLGKKNNDGKTQISVIYLNTLSNQDEKEFFLSILTSQLYQWMLANPSDKLQCVYFIDEIAPFLPAGSEKPMPKPILRLLFKQARKYGIGCIIATQNPGDIDYKAFSQFGTWAIGRLSVKQDQKKVEKALKSVSSKDFSSRLPKLSPGHFLLFAPDISKELKEINVRWLYSKHETLNEDDVKQIMDPKRHEYQKFIVKKNKKISEALELQEKVVSKDKREKDVLFFSGLSRKDILVLANSVKKRKFRVVGEKESVLELITELVPYIKLKVRVSESMFFGMKKQLNEYTVFCHGITGNLIKINKHQFKEISEFNKVLTLESEDIKLIKWINKNKKDVNSVKAAREIGLSEKKISSMLTKMKGKKLLDYDKKNKKYELLDLAKINLPKIRNLASAKLDIKQGSIEGTKLAVTVKEKDVSNALKNWFENSEISETEIVYLPEYIVKFELEDRIRLIKINGVNGRISHS